MFPYLPLCSTIVCKCFICDVDPDQHHFGNLDPHQIKIRNRKKNQDPDPHESDKLGQESDPDADADDKPKCMEYEPTLPWCMHGIFIEHLYLRYIFA
jgi:hypothetical protein